MTIPNNIILDPGAPFSQEAEEAVIGSVLIDPSAYVDVASFLQPDDFFLLRHQYIWEAFNWLEENSEQIDLITVAERLENVEVLDNIGGRAYLVQLLNNTGTSVYAEVYGRLVETTSTRRKGLILADTLKKDLMDEALLLSDVLATHQGGIMDLQIDGKGMAFVPVSDAVSRHMDEFERRRSAGKKIIGYSSGYNLLDWTLQGFEKGRLYTIGAVTGMGKSAFMLNLLLRLARELKEEQLQAIPNLPVQPKKETLDVVWFSYENMESETVTRAIANMAGIDSKRISAGTTGESETQRYYDSTGELSNLNIHITDNAELNIKQLRAMCRKLKYAGKLDAICVDYLQIIPPAVAKKNRVEELGDISGDLKLMAKELGVPVITAVQLNREGFKTGRKPKISDIRESGKIEHDSDVIMLLHSDTYFDIDPDERSKPVWDDFEVNVAKNRGGNMGECYFVFERPYLRFTEIVPESQHSQHYAN